MCIYVQILWKLEQKQVIKNRASAKLDYLSAIAQSVRSQISASECTISAAKLVRTWSALMCAFMLMKLSDQLLKSGPVSCLLPAWHARKFSHWLMYEATRNDAQERLSTPMACRF